VFRAVVEDRVFQGAATLLTLRCTAPDKPCDGLGWTLRGLTRGAQGQPAAGDAEVGSAWLVRLDPADVVLLR
jgi:hypothetical protein